MKLNKKLFRGGSFNQYAIHARTYSGRQIASCSMNLGDEPLKKVD
jgi:hypothetical protein